MLYNEAWSKSKVEVKADPFSLESIIAWGEKQPADRNYNWVSSDCYLCQYLKANGYKVSDYDKININDRVDVAFDRPHTFGAALTRAREALASRA